MLLLLLWILWLCSKFLTTKYQQRQQSFFEFRFKQPPWRDSSGFKYFMTAYSSIVCFFQLLFLISISFIVLLLYICTHYVQPLWKFFLFSLIFEYTNIIIFFCGKQNKYQLPNGWPKIHEINNWRAQSEKSIISCIIIIILFTRSD